MFESTYLTSNYYNNDIALVPYTEGMAVAKRNEYK